MKGAQHCLDIGKELSDVDSGDFLIIHIDGNLDGQPCIDVQLVLHIEEDGGK